MEIPQRVLGAPPPSAIHPRDDAAAEEPYAQPRPAARSDLAVLSDEAYAEELRRRAKFEARGAICTQSLERSEHSGSSALLWGKPLHGGRDSARVASAMTGLRYKDAGVDIDAGAELIKRLRKRQGSANAPNILGGIGGFASLVELPKKFRRPVLVAGTDGVGTKLKLAFESNRHDTVGIDLVAMCVNDIITCGATPLFFLDYFATSSLDVDQAEAVIKGIIEGCERAGCALVGGETAELPGFFAPGEYDIAGFALGVVEHDAILDGKKIDEGDAIIGLASTGLHSNGFSLAQRALFETKALPLDHHIGGHALINLLLEPTRIYEPLVRPLLTDGMLHGLAHITGGGLVENLPRILPKALGATLYKDAWRVPEIFALIQEAGSIESDEMFRVFNMGIGMTIVCDSAASAEVQSRFRELGCDAWEIGRVTPRNDRPLQWA